MSESIEPRYPDRLIVPLDGSRAADLVVPFSAAIADHGDLPVTVLHVFSSVRDLAAAADGDIAWSEDADPRGIIRPPASIRQAVELLNERNLDVQVVGRVGKADEEILDELEREPGAWISMTTLGMSGFRSLFLGSTARSVVWASDRPVLLIPADEETASMPTGGLAARVAVFLDGTSLAERAVWKATGLAKILNAELDLVRVAETMQDDTEDLSDEDEQWEARALRPVESYLHSISAACSDTGVPINVVPRAGTPEVQLPKYVEEAMPTIVVLSTRRRSGIERWTYGSFAERMVQELHIPLLLVPVDDVSPEVSGDDEG